MSDVNELPVVKCEPIETGSSIFLSIVLIPVSKVCRMPRSSVLVESA